MGIGYSGSVRSRARAKVDVDRYAHVPGGHSVVAGHLKPCALLAFRQFVFRVSARVAMVGHGKGDGVSAKSALR
jgi:hypothetical protein